MPTVLACCLCALCLLPGGVSAFAAPRDLGSLLEPIRRKHHLPALAGAIVTGEGLAAVGAVGVRKEGDPTPVTVADRFHLGSCTKAMTATLIARLVEEGKLTWDLTLERAFPEWREGMDPAYRAVTLEQLLAHRSGMSAESWPKDMNFLSLHALPGNNREKRRAYVEKVLREPPVHAPGSQFLYSNRNYAVAGHIAERAVDKPWEQLITERLFRPLGMKTMGFGAMGRPGRVEQPWQHRFADGKPVPIEPGPLSDNPAVIGPGGTVHGSIGDWAKIVAAHLRGEQDKPGLLKPATFRKLHTPPPGGDYGFGWGTAERGWGGGTVLSHSGSNNQNFAVVWMAPKRGFGVLVMTNIGGDAAAQATDEAASALIGDYLQTREGGAK